MHRTTRDVFVLCRRGAFDVYLCHTCSLYGGTWIEMPASFVVTFCWCGQTMCFSRWVRLLLIVIAAGISVSAETRKPIYRSRRYCKATSEYSPIRSIGLTLFITIFNLHYWVVWYVAYCVMVSNAILFAVGIFSDSWVVWQSWCLLHISAGWPIVTVNAA